MRRGLHAARRWPLLSPLRRDRRQEQAPLRKGRTTLAWRPRPGGRVNNRCAPRLLRPSPLRPPPRIGPTAPRMTRPTPRRSRPLGSTITTSRASIPNPPARPPPPPSPAARRCPPRVTTSRAASSRAQCQAAGWVPPNGDATPLRECRARAVARGAGTTAPPYDKPVCACLAARARISQHKRPCGLPSLPAPCGAERLAGCGRVVLQAPAVFPVPRGRRGAAERLPRCGGAVHAGAGGGLRGAPLRNGRRCPFCATWPQSGLEFLTRASPPSADHADPRGDRKAYSAPLMRALAGGPGKGTAAPPALVRLHPARSPHSAPATREAEIRSCGRAPNDQRSRPASRAAARAGARSCGAGHAKSGGHDAGRSCHAPRSTLRSSTRSGRNCCRQQPPGGYAGRSGPAAARTVPAALPRPACRRAGV